MPESPLASSLAAVLEDPSFKALLKSSREDYLSWEQLLRMPLPASFSAMDTWELLGSIRRSEAETLPRVHPDAPLAWYSRTLRICGSLSQIDQKCTSGSILDRALNDNSGRPSLVRSRIHEAAAVARIDGLDVSDKVTRHLLQEGYAPRTDNERLIVNTMFALLRISDWADRPFTPETMAELRSLLLDGVDVASLKYSRTERGVLPVFQRSRLAAEAGKLAPHDRASLVCRIANNEVQPEFHPAVTALLLNTLPVLLAPLPDMNSQVGRLMSQLYAIKNNLPVLGLLPITVAMVKWSKSEVPFRDTRVNPDSYFSWMEADPQDFTPAVAVLTDLALRLIGDLEASMRRAQQRDDAIRLLLQDDQDLNQRQRLILARASRNPDAEFKVAYHKTNHGVTHTTARRDLVALVERGFLTRQPRGHGYVYTAVPEIQSLLGVKSTDAPDNTE